MALNTARNQITKGGYTFDRNVTRVSVRVYRFGANVVSVPTERVFACQWERFVSSRKGPKRVTGVISRQQAAAMLRAYRTEGATVTRSRINWEVV